MTPPHDHPDLGSPRGRGNGLKARTSLTGGTSPEVTIYDVAHAAGVSISTVSNALNRPERVADATRERILSVAGALGFVPKAAAVSQARKAMRRIAVLAPFTSYASYLSRLRGILAEATGQGIDVSVFDHESAAIAVSRPLASLPIRGQFDGVIVMGTRIDDVVERRLFERGVAAVVVDAESDRFPVVSCDEVAGGRTAAAYLHQLGHRRYVYLVERQLSDYDSQGLRRLVGFRQELDILGGCQLRVVESEPTAEATRVAAHELLANPDRPTAVMAHFDDMALGVLRAAKALQLAVPHELSIMGYDDGPVADAADLTTVRQPFEESGAVATRILLAALDSPRGSRTVTLLNSAVIERSTVASVVSASVGAATN